MGFGTISTRNFDLERGVIFTTGMEGRSSASIGAVASLKKNHLVLHNGRGNTVSVGVTGSGDVTFDAE